MEDDDQSLLLRVARRDVRAFEALYDRYGRAVYSLALGLLHDAQAAEEVAQDVFLAIWRSARDFDPQRGQARPWILSMAHHKSVDALRRRRLRAAEALSATAVGDEDVAADAMRAAEARHVREVLAALPHAQREAIALAYYEGYTQQEIADRLGIPLGTVKTRVRDGLLRLRDLLGRHGMETDR
jgi:RNA polymerase sigma-70 factor (ECF subfamily)